MSNRRDWSDHDLDIRRSRRDETGVPLALIISLAVGIPVAILVIVMAFMLAMPAADPFDFPPMAFEQPPFDNDNPFEMPPGFNAEPNQVPGALPQPPAPPGVPGKKTVDLIQLVDPLVDNVGGRRWGLVNGALHCSDIHMVPRIQIPYQPPQEYDFTVTFSQPNLRNGISLIMPKPKGDGSFFWFLGSEMGSAYGFHANPDKGGRIPGLVAPQTICTTTVQVRKDGVKASVNGKQLIDHKTDFKDLLCDNWREIPDTRVLAVACDDPTVFHHLRVVEITGVGKRTR